MSIATSLTKLETDITNAYNTINTRGGTIPTDKNTNNLPTAIDSIPSGGPTPITVFSIVNNATYGYNNHLITDIVWKDIKKIEIWFKHLETKTNNMLISTSSNTGGIVSPWISETASGSLTGFTIVSSEVVDGYTHKVMTFSSSNTNNLFIGCWTDSGYSSINAFKRLKMYGENDTLLNDMTPAKMGNMIGFYDEITKGFYGINNFNGIVEGEYS